MLVNVPCAPKKNVYSEVLWWSDNVNYVKLVDSVAQVIYIPINFFFFCLIVLSITIKEGWSYQ